MSSGLLDFFTLEASEYVEQLDGLVTRATDGPPELDGFSRSARALRGSATMAKVSGIAEVAGALERVAYGLRSGALSWSGALCGASIAAIDDLKLLVRGVRTWGEAETRRAAACAQELAVFAPITARTDDAAPNAFGFLATETAELAQRLADFAHSPLTPAAFAPSLQRVRGLRGMAVLKDLPPLPEVVDALDAAATSFEVNGAFTPALRALFMSAAQLLADGSIALTRGERPATASRALSAFAAATAAFGGTVIAVDEVLPISALFPADGSAGLVSAAAAPPTTAAQRFRLDVVSQSEHLRRLVGDVARAVDSATSERLGRELGAAALALSLLAASFGEAPSLVGGGPASSGDVLHAMLEQGIAGLSGLDDAPLAEPAAVPDDVTVPIEDLFYRGKEALERAIELRDAMRGAGGAPDPMLLAELYDLLELAATAV